MSRFESSQFDIEFQLVEVLGTAREDDEFIPDARELVRDWFLEHDLEADVAQVQIVEADCVAYTTANVGALVARQRRRRIIHDFNNRQDQLVRLNDYVVRVKISVARLRPSSSQ